MTATEPAASGGLLAAMRPRQWTKNLLLYAGIVFAAELDDPERWVQATAAFVAYCSGLEPPTSTTTCGTPSATGSIRSSATGRSRAGEFARSGP